MTKESVEHVNFGFRAVKKNAKEKMVQRVFSDVAPFYDIMNDVMSFGLHRIWKNKFVSQLRPIHDDYLLDLAGGTGDIAMKFLQNGGGKAIICDLNENMLKYGHQKRIDTGLETKSINIVCANAENLPFEDNTFDCCTISFGIRNFTDMQQALHEVRRVLKPGGTFLCLEFSKISHDLLRKFYEFYSFNIIPKIGQLIANNSDHYAYLAESIKMFPDAQKFADIIETTGFHFVSYTKMTFGIVAIHKGYK